MSKRIRRKKRLTAGRNPSKNTIKKVSRPANGMFNGWGHRTNSYGLFNSVGANIYNMTKGKLCNRAGIGLKKYWTKADHEEYARYLKHAGVTE